MVFPAFSLWFFCGGNSPESIAQGAARWQPKSCLRARGCTDCFFWSISGQVTTDLQAARFFSLRDALRKGAVASSSSVMDSERCHSSLDVRYWKVHRDAAARYTEAKGRFFGLQILSITQVIAATLYNRPRQELLYRQRSLPVGK